HGAKAPLVVCVDGVQDPGNLGTIVRSADAVGATAVVLGRGTVDLYNPKTVRSTMGSLFHLPIVEAELEPLLAEAGARGVQLVVTSLQAQESCYAVDFTRGTWFVVGNEGRGVSDSVARHVNRHVIIPMPGGSESLNVAMAATVLLFEASRQRLKTIISF
ncbi:TrmH family RNA methyltransferase, partial [Paenibacillus koleovorans]|uniref:TrmH family RNA methyltransferase n=1 Tax=Paenibacillus koleovorans TaxID=121608 RepID=UPI0013E2D170